MGATDENTDSFTQRQKNTGETDDNSDLFTQRQKVVAGMMCVVIISIVLAIMAGFGLFDKRSVTIFDRTPSLTPTSEHLPLTVTLFKDESSVR